jgi:2-pyrone-4,6-dicarboxylate lactonase
MMVHLATPPDPDTSTPVVVCPPGTVDTHLHLFGPLDRYPLIPSPPYLTGDALPESGIAMHDKLGVDYGVLVSGGAYGRSCDYLLHVLDNWGDHFRAVAVPPADPTDAELDRLARAGVRGIRFTGDSAGTHVAHIEPELAARAFELGWHVQFVAQPGELESHADRLLALPNDLVLDHFGGVKVELGIDQPAVRLLLAMLDTGRVWVKLSGPMYSSRLEFPYADVGPLARLLVREAPERLLWGTDWPHLHMGERRMPNDAELLDLMLDWAPDERVRNRILSDNPRELYGFPTGSRRTDGG